MVWCSQAEKVQLQHERDEARTALHRLEQTLSAQLTEVGVHHAAELAQAQLQLTVRFCWDARCGSC